MIPMSNLASLYSSHITDLLSRHRLLMQNNDFEYLVIPSGIPIRIYQDDQDYSFKSSYLFRTYLPLTELAHSYLIIGLTGKPVLVYSQPDDYWHSAPEKPSGFWSSHFEVLMISQESQASDFMPTQNNKVALLGEDTCITEKLIFADKILNNCSMKYIGNVLIKSDYEVVCLKIANQKAALAHKVAEQEFRSGKSEQQIHLAYVETTGLLEHQMPYNNIVALNNHASILHYTTCETKVPRLSKSLLIDAGVSFNGYHSDITRTYSQESGGFADLIQAVDEIQLNCIESINVGQNFLDLHIDTHLKIAKIIQQFNFVDMSIEGMVESGVTSAFFPHGLGHLIGLQVHDVGGQFSDPTGVVNSPPASHPFLRCTRSIEVGMTLTIEPGLYFINSLLTEQQNSKNGKAFNWDKIEDFIPYGGIRIEDNILIQKDGVLNLTRNAFSL